MPYDTSAAAQELRRQAENAPFPWRKRDLEIAADRAEAGARQLARAERLTTGVGNAALGIGEALTSAGGALSQRALSGAGKVVTFLANNPRIGRPVAMATLAAPIMLSDAGSYANRGTEAILRSYHNPERMVAERDVMASLDSFLEKKAAFSPRHGFMSELGGGVTKGLGEELGKALVYGAGRLFGGLRDALSGDPRKKRLLESLMQSDQVIADAVKRSPGAVEQLMQAYSTLNKFAPTLASDVNAVRSFLREVVLGGGHVNYATIKNLVETEKSIHGNQPMYKGSL